MRKILSLGLLSVSFLGFSQQVEFTTLLKDKISIRALELSAGWLLLGIFVYIFYGKNNSKLNNPDKITED
ncbi:hypothetical protein [Elizabethkingia anophelis]|uniref:hypothetical protein n=1 Tax=Elizabethkingia anophelis TaxID=1117645 RepID=UPI003F1CCDE4